MDNQTWALLEAALNRGSDGADRVQIEAELASGRLQLWPGDGGVLVTQLIATPEGRFVHCWLGGGHLRALLDLRAGVEAWGRAQGCDFASINGRRGWDRVLRKLGYVRQGGELVKAL